MQHRDFYKVDPLNGYRVNPDIRLPECLWMYGLNE